MISRFWGLVRRVEVALGSMPEFTSLNWDLGSDRRLSYKHVMGIGVSPQPQCSDIYTTSVRKKLQG